MTAIDDRSFVFGDHFLSSTNSLSNEDKGRVMGAVAKFDTDPSRSSLRLEKLEGESSGRIYSIRASQEIRILILKEGGIFVLLEAGHHSIYEKLGRTRFVINHTIGFYGFIGNSDESEGFAPIATRSTHGNTDDLIGVLDHWGDKDLLGVGFSQEVIAVLRSAKSPEQLCDLAGSGSLPLEDFDRAVDLFELTPEQWNSPQLLVDANDAEQRLRKAIAEFGPAHGLSTFFSAEDLAKIASAPIEDWMIFLHPDQHAIVRRRYEGPARVRGAAGTGKTVVALHRAAELARRFHSEEQNELPILFTTFINSLPPVFESLYGRLPTSHEGNEIEFINIDKLARRIVTESGRTVQTKPPEINAAFASAFKQIIDPVSPLGKAALTKDYLKTEISSVIKGRGVVSLEEYLVLERTGRRVPFSSAMRQQVWELREAWDEGMSTRETFDFSDVMIMARDLVVSGEGPRYRAAVIDESQDLTLVGLQLVRGLTQTEQGVDKADGLLLVGDGGQRIYPGGFTLRQAGLQIAGRSTVLRANYRNTAEIFSAALAVTGDSVVEDLDESDVYKRGDVDVSAKRGEGARPMLIECAGEDDETQWIMERIQELIQSGAARFGDIGLFTHKNREAKRWLDVLSAAQIPRADLSRSGGALTDEVKVGTYHRAKGLEFKAVFLPGVNQGFPRPRDYGQDEQEYDEQRTLAVSQLYVAMTRARDALFITTSGTPSDMLLGALESFDIVTS